MRAALRLGSPFRYARRRFAAALLLMTMSTSASSMALGAALIASGGLTSAADAQGGAQPSSGIPNIGGGDKTPPVVEVAPATGTDTLINLPVTITWCDNVSLVANSRSIEFDGVAVTSSFTYQTTTEAGCAAAATSSGTVSLRPGKADTLVAAIADGALNRGSGTAIYTYTSPPHPIVSITPDDLAQNAAPNSVGLIDTFTVANTGGASGQITLSTTGCVAPAVNCGAPSSGSVTLAPNQTAPITVTFGTNGTPAGGGLVKLHGVAGTSQDDGTIDVNTALPCETALTAIRPCTSTMSEVVSKRAIGKEFIVTNMNPHEPVSYSLSTTNTGAVVVDSIHPSSLVVQSDSSKAIDVFFDTKSTPGTGTFTFTADDGQAAVTASVTVTVANPPPPKPFLNIAVTPHHSALDVDPGAPAARTFTLVNNSTDSATIKYTRACAGSAIASGCTSSTDTVHLGAGATSNVSIAFTSSLTGGATGRLSLIAWLVSDTTVRDSGSADVTVVRDNNGVVDVASVNAGSTLERSLCLHVSVAKGVSYECGDLRVAYALPTTTTLTNARTPVLLYNSRFAYPHVVIAANVTLPDTRIPDSVSARLLDSVGVKLDSAKWSGTNWAPLSTRRIALMFDPVATRNYQNGAQRYALEVTRFYGGVASRDTVSGEFFVVRRDHSQFGHGWWVAGLERLTLTPGLSTMFWVGGDGSAREYVRSPSNPNAWGAANVDRPDTVRRVGNRFVRFLPHGLKVQFDTVYGCHMETVNRLGQTTTFAYTDANCGRLSTITLAPASANKVYTFSYENVAGNWRLTRVDAPAISGQARFDSISRNANDQVTRIGDVYGDTLAFGYRASYDARVTKLIDQRGDSLSFTYYSTAPSPLVQASIPLAAGSNAVTGFTPLETRGLQGTAALTLGAANTKVDGPRTDVGDTTEFWLTALGAPNRIRDALGDETLIAYDSAIFPGLAARVQHANGQIVAATYDDLGHVKTVTDSTTFTPSPLKYATTSYTWDPAWDFITGTVNPEGDASSATYDPANGNTLTETDGAGHQVRFSYYTTGTATALLSAVTYASGATDSLFYDSQQGNLSRTLSALGNATGYARDDAGRVVADTTPNDSTTGFHITRHLLDLLGRDTLTIDSAGAQALRVRQHYDRAGNLDTLWKWSTPDPNAIGTEKQAFVYDRANRKTTETLLGSQPVTWTYDPAGNVVDGGRRPTSNTYDALNRRIMAAGSETATYGYDAVGHLVYANNPYARVARAYNANGTLAADTLRIATADSTAGDFSQHVYGIENGYDLDGRRISITYPATLAGSGSVAHYAYDAQTGMLDTVRDLAGNQFRYQYDADGRLVRLTRFAQSADSVWETDGYDVDSRLVRRVQASATFTFHNDTVTYDRAGKANGDATDSDGGSVVFASFGWLRAASYPGTPGPEQITDDALGNHATMWVPATRYSQHVYRYTPGSDRDTMAVQPSTPTDTTKYYYGAFGEAGEHVDVHDFNPVGSRSNQEIRDVVNAYNAQQQLIRSHYTLDTAFHTSDPPPNYKAYNRVEYYRYDALGRRIFQRMVLDTGVICQHDDPVSGCKSLLTRTVWDGNQVLYDIRAPGDTNNAQQEDDDDEFDPYGQVAYIDGPGIDQPLELIKNGTVVLPLQNWRSLYDLGACPTTCGLSSVVQLPGGAASSYGDHAPQSAPAWWGSIVSGSQDGSGYQYRRNRYYDPQTGRFTQEDPLGLAGGLNAYGFANDDPITYSDPFGLDPWWWQTAARVSIEVVALAAHLHLGPLQSPQKEVVRPAESHPIEQLLEPAHEVGPETMGKTSSETMSDIESNQAMDAATAASAKVAAGPPPTPFELPSGETLTNIGSAADGAPIFQVAPAVAPTAEAAAPVAEAASGAEGISELVAFIAALF